MKKLHQTIFSNLNEKEVASINEIAKRAAIAIGLVERLRGRNGCPWDREQNPLSIRQYLIEEAYETLDIIDRYQVKKDRKKIASETPKSEPVSPDGNYLPSDAEKLKEELGDLLLQILLHSKFASERKEFDFGDVAEKLAEKLVFRHPHVFGDQKLENSDEVLVNWEALKKKEGKKGVLDGLPKDLPSLQRAARIGEKAKKLHFDWKDWQGAWAKVNEEVAELKEALDGFIETKNIKEVENELGDLFFSLSQLARHLNIAPEDAHRKSISRFEERFSLVEEYFSNQKKEIQTATDEELEHAWSYAKSKLAQKQS
ncbi:MAG: nucleoside triphosphate pyrophosphohydrolase [Bacteriovoracia bacterium]